MKEVALAKVYFFQSTLHGSLECTDDLLLLECLG